MDHKKVIFFLLVMTTNSKLWVRKARFWITFFLGGSAFGGAVDQKI